MLHEQFFAESVHEQIILAVHPGHQHPRPPKIKTKGPPVPRQRTPSLHKTNPLGPATLGRTAKTLCFVVCFQARVNHT